MRKHPRNCFQGTLTMPPFTKLQISLDWGLTTGFNPDPALNAKHSDSMHIYLFCFLKKKVFVIIKLPLGTWFKLRCLQGSLAFLKKERKRSQDKIRGVESVPGVSFQWNSWEKASKSSPSHHRWCSGCRAAQLPQSDPKTAVWLCVCVCRLG